MKKILFPLDFSKTSDNAFLYALEMAKMAKAELVMLHTFEFPVIDSQSLPLNYAIVYDTIELSNFDQFKEVMNRWRAVASERNLDNIEMSHILMDGDLISSIKRVIEQEHIDMVIMGTNGAKGWFETFIGTNTSSVIAKVSVPVLSIPVEAHYDKVKTIGFTTHFSQKDIAALKEVVSYAKMFNAKIKCLYVKTADLEVDEEDIRYWKSHFENEDNIEFFTIKDENVQGTIKDFLESQKVDLLAMLTHKRNFLKELFSRSITQQLSCHLKKPLLALH